MRSFLGNAFYKVFIIRVTAIIFVAEADTGNDRYPGLWACKPKYKFVACCKKVLPDDKEHGILDSLPVYIGAETVKYNTRINLSPVSDIPVKDYRVITDPHRGTGNRGNRSTDRCSQTLRRTMIPKNMDVHSNTILEWMGINVLRIVSAGI